MRTPASVARVRAAQSRDAQRRTTEPRADAHRSTLATDRCVHLPLGVDSIRARSVDVTVAATQARALPTRASRWRRGEPHRAPRHRTPWELAAPPWSQVLRHHRRSADGTRLVRAPRHPPMAAPRDRMGARRTTGRGALTRNRSSLIVTRAAGVRTLVLVSEGGLVPLPDDTPPPGSSSQRRQERRPRARMGSTPSSARQGPTSDESPERCICTKSVG